MSIHMNKLYEDAMDHERFLMPVKLEGKELTCKVYFGKGDRKNFVGTTKIGTSLFDNATSEVKETSASDWNNNRRHRSFSDRIGFKLVDPNKPKVALPPPPKLNRDDDLDD